MNPIIPPLLWLSGGLLLMLAELAAPGAFLVWIGLAAFGTGVATLLGLGGVEPQVICFAVLAAVAVAGGGRLRRVGSKPAVNTPESGLLGRTAVALHFSATEGRVRVGDSDWPARLAVPGETPPGTRLKVVGVEGLVLLVAPEAGR